MCVCVCVYVCSVFMEGAAQVPRCRDRLCGRGKQRVEAEQKSLAIEDDVNVIGKSWSRCTRDCVGRRMPSKYEQSTRLQRWCSRTRAESLGEDRPGGLLVLHMFAFCSWANDCHYL